MKSDQESIDEEAQEERMSFQTKTSLICVQILAYLHISAGFTIWWNKCPMPSMRKPFSVVVEKAKDAVTEKECDPQEKEKAEQEIREERTAKS